MSRPIISLLCIAAICTACGDSADDSPVPVDDTSSTSESGADAGTSDGQWWLNDVSADAEAPDSLEGSGTTGPDKGGSTMTIHWAGTIDVSAMTGTLNVSANDIASDALLCDLMQPVQNLTEPSDPCTECSFSWIVTFGEATLQSGTEDACMDGSLSQGTLSLGHGAEGLYIGGKEAGWALAGESSFADPTWTFNLSYSPSATGSGDGKDDVTDPDACYEECIAKGASEEVCEDYCGGDKENGGDGGDGGDKDEDDEDGDGDGK